MALADKIKEIEELQNKEAPEFEPYKYRYEARNIIATSINEYNEKLKKQIIIT